MVLDLHTRKSGKSINKQRIATQIVTSEKFIKEAAKKASEELKDEGPYIYTKDEEKEATIEDKSVRRKRLFF